MHFFQVIHELITIYMKILFRTFILLACASLLQQCEETVAPQVKPAFDDVNTSAAKINPFVLYAINNFPYNSLLFQLGGTPGFGVSVDWGDGTSTEFSFDPNYDILEKIYETPGRYKVTVSGDIREITYFNCNYDNGVFDSINVSGLRKLESFRLSLIHGPQVLDLSSNTQLTEVDLTNVHELSEILLPRKHRIQSMSIAGPNQLTTAVVDRVIKSTYDNAVKAKLYFGYFNAQKLFYLYTGEEGYDELVGPPSASSLAKLQELRDVYSWEVHP
jgi:hypothetical protein